MPFGLKNVGTTYQRMMQACLKEQIGKNMQVYVDDIVIKTYSASTLLDDLRETFATLNKYRIKLNPKKCVFCVPAGKLIGYMVSARGIEANPEKSSSHRQDAGANRRQRRATTHRKTRSFEPFHRQTGRTHAAI